MPTTDLEHSNVSRPATSVDPGLETVPNKVHLRGLDELSTEDIKTIVSEFYNVKFERVEWVDDTSANLVYGDSVAANDALTRVTNTAMIPAAGLSSTDLRPARPSSKFPGSNLQIRVALTTDKKRPRAHETSRFYLLHPEHDPREQRRQPEGRVHLGRRGYRKRMYSAEEDRKRRQQDLQDGFDASMYDDDGGSPQKSTESSPMRREPQLIDSYRPSRNRSASPDGHQRPARTRQRRRTPPPPRRSRQADESIRSNEHKELLPGKVATAQSKKELFPSKTGIGHHRRTDAFDAADETADLFANKFLVPFTDGSNEKGSLASRITGPSQRSPSPKKTQVASLDDVSDHLSPDAVAGGQGVRIRGVSQDGLAIKGGASQGNGIKELFPQRLNTGKELFSDKLSGKRQTRLKAHDLY